MTKGKGETAKGKGEAAEEQGRTSEGGESIQGKEEGYVKPCLIPSAILACTCMSATEWEGYGGDCF